ncbi:ABC transporter permease [Cohnella fermenti]|uniref:Sugar ABC transporter permease n=1 Tax=Cohnella fermenti TaxID=2565925 RepID=A0A4S4BTV2_9BACL|nr:ABC transporter permease subunit [Cohnella fermenti]THF77760.1 sugar ABC transporter permease [Cohnella fermenti]
MMESSRWMQARRNIIRGKYLYLMLALPVVYFALFKYGPMYGVVIAFKDFKVYDGIMGSDWVGLKYFKRFLSDPNFWTLVKNTIVLGLYMLIFGFPAPILFALLVNEIRQKWYKKTVQSISYLPHFISMVVVVSMVVTFTKEDGLINQITGLFGAEPISFLLHAEWFRTVFVASEIWQTIGWSSIIYLAALSGVNPEETEAAVIDGANRLQQMRYVVLPAITPTIVIMFIMNIGSILDVSFEKVLLLQNPSIYETADVISTYVFRKGLEGFQYSFATAVGLFNSIVNLMFLVAANQLARKFGNSSLW